MSTFFENIFNGFADGFGTTAGVIVAVIVACEVFELVARKRNENEEDEEYDGE